MQTVSTTLPTHY